MKTTFYNLIISTMLLFGLQGCYTLLWSPEMEFPNEYNSDYTYGSSYYYEDYNYFYSYPWWFRINPPMIINDKTNQRNDEGQSLRNNDGGRPGGNGNVPIPGTPSRTSGGSGSSTGSPNKGGDNNSGTTTRSSEDSTKDSSLRNNDSGRNTDKGRR